jgi:hypothetical protein
MTGPDRPEQRAYLLGEATWHLPGERGDRRTPLILPPQIRWETLPAILAVRELRDPGRADEVTITGLAIVHERDLPGNGASVLDPYTATIRITSRPCARCPYTAAMPQGFAATLALIRERKAHLVCGATAQPGAPAAICRPFALGPWRHSIALQLAAATGNVAAVQPPDPPTPPA